ncbi:MAG: hypothetical protein C0591_07510 [Marinilabiliales bacterium]|nr:MAG: hypothetical protein C0591_07510 [Marinilabiliales bacterium]
MKRISIIVVIFFFAFSCKKNDTPVPVIEIPMGTLEFIASYDLDIPEPSGLSFGSGSETLLTVSDNTNQVYEIDLEGKIIRMLDYEGKDLEGVTYNPDKDLIAVVEETDREVTLLDYSSGNKEGTYKITIPFGADNSGLEGISYNSNNKFYYIVNETNPDLMVIWNPDYGIISEVKLRFASDYSGIFVDVSQSLLWIVSDQSEGLYKCDYSGKVLMSFKLDDIKYEGVVVDNDMVYLVNDATSNLELYKIITD